MEGYHNQYQHQQQQTAGDRFPQWSSQETKEFLRIRGEMDKAFMETKRNKLLWEVIATKLREKGFGRNAEQCKSKWKNLVTRYKGCETMEPEATRQQFPYYNEMHTIFSSRLHQMLWAEAEDVSGSATGRKKKRISTATSDQSWSDDDDDVEEREYNDDGENKKKRKKKKNMKEESDHDKGLRGVVEKLMRQHEEMEVRWREAYEVREEERRRREEEWRREMVALEEERRRMERSWREREEERRVKEEVRSIKRDALINALLNRLRRDDDL